MVGRISYSNESEKDNNKRGIYTEDVFERIKQELADPEKFKKYVLKGREDVREEDILKYKLEFLLENMDKFSTYNSNARYLENIRYYFYTLKKFFSEEEAKRINMYACVNNGDFFKIHSIVKLRPSEKSKGENTYFAYNNTDRKYKEISREELKRFVDRAKGLEIIGEIDNKEQIDIEELECIIFNEKASNCESNVHINIFQGLPKSDKMELIIQKSVELGADEITPVEMKRSVVKIDEKSKQKKIERWQKISEVAAKQSGRDIVPKINNIVNIKNICNLINKYDIVLLAYENEKNNKLKNELTKLKNKENLKIGVIIGPEGGLEEQEVEILKEAGAKVITLGNRILRTETVALVVTGIIMYELENLEGNK